MATVSFKVLERITWLNWITLLIIGAVVLAARLLHVSIETWDETVPLCAFKLIWHLPCPLCGLTRSLALALQGDWALAIQFHVLGPPLLILMFSFLISRYFYPGWANWLLSTVQRPRMIVTMCLLLLACWAWKLEQNPRFW